MSKKVGIIGLGSVGWATVHSLSPKYEYCGYDIADSYDFSAILSSDIVFICVQTPLSQENRLDSSAVDDVLSQLDEAGYKNCIVVKSTLSVGFMTKAAEMHPKLRLVYMPEFLRERSSFTWCMEPDRIVVSGNDTDMEEALSYFTWVPESVPRLKMSWRSAEIGKLAHNAYIATKVSFTNEVEALSLMHDADPYDVMHLVWTDRRVNCPEHLTPYLGGYSGKCVPKDTTELMNCGGKHILLEAVETVNNSLRQKPNQTSRTEIITIIPTHSRPEYLQKAIASVANQRKQPSKVYIVYDDGDSSYHEIERIASEFSSSLFISVLKNSHTKKLSGAVNTALEQAEMEFPDTMNTFVSNLDDDDWWDISYLQNVSKYADETKADWIISGLIRHDERNPNGYHQPVPQTLKADMFYISNPNIQGSNLFVRLSKMLEIGGFDENLMSTTDRDVGIRLCKANTSYSVLNNHLVHHNAIDDHPRLSVPGCMRKVNGMRAFYQKHSPNMTDEEKDAFKQRASKLFSVDIEESA